VAGPDAPDNATEAPFSGKVDVRLFFPASGNVCPDTAPSSSVTLPTLDFSADPSDPASTPKSRLTVNIPAQALHPRARLWMKPVDAADTDKASCSNDLFSIRPPNFVLRAWQDAGHSQALENSASASGAEGASAPAGRTFWLSHETIDGLGTLTENAQQITAEYAGTKQQPAQTALDGDCFSPTGCAYDNVGVLAFAAGAWHDAGQFTGQSGDYSEATCQKAEGKESANTPGCDCNDGAEDRYSDEKKGNKVGCFIANRALTAGRWYPAKFAVQTRLAPSCQTLAYMGEPGALDLGLSIVAQAVDGQTTTLYRHDGLTLATQNGGAAADLLGRLTPADASAGYWPFLLTDPGAFAAQWQDGQWRFAPVPTGNRHGNTTFVRQGGASGKATPDGDYRFALLLALADADLTKSGAAIIAVEAADDTTCTVDRSSGQFTCQNATPADVRFGRLVAQSVYGPKDRPLRVPVEMQYWRAGNWRQNTLDDCTRLATPQTANDWHLADESGLLRPNTDLESFWKHEEAQAGNSPIVLHKPGNTTDGPGKSGHADVLLRPMLGNSGAADYRGWLEDPAWPEKPKVRVCFGACGQRQNFIWKGDVIAPRH
ncbi:MAG: hypothetical protein LBL69_04865, partial [Zoogloeaceae bacterium]|nr:hypothetical protein [Zoogloeaceae bacterium]